MQGQLFFSRMIVGCIGPFLFFVLWAVASQLSVVFSLGHLVIIVCGGILHALIIKEVLPQSAEFLVMIGDEVLYAIMGVVIVTLVLNTKSYEWYMISLLVMILVVIVGPAVVILWNNPKPARERRQKALSRSV